MKPVFRACGEHSLLLPLIHGLSGVANVFLLPVAGEAGSTEVSSAVRDVQVGDKVEKVCAGHESDMEFE